MPIQSPAAIKRFVSSLLCLSPQPPESTSNTPTQPANTSTTSATKMSTHHVVRTLPIATRLRHTGPGAAKELLNRDRARAQKHLAGLHPHGPRVWHELRSKHKHRKPTEPSDPSPAPPSQPSDPSSGDSVGVIDAGVTYTTQVGVGSPATDYTLLIDTGSSNTWVGANKKYVQTSTSKKTRDTVNVSYGSGSFSGSEFLDTVTLAKGLVITEQSIGVASKAQGFSDVDGILGIGPVDLTSGTLSSGEPVPTVTDNLFTQGTIAENSIGISYEPSTSDNVANGELTFGGTDPTKFTGEITFVPITSTSPASQYWGIDQSVT